MSGSTIKLEINSNYLLFTNYSTINNVKVKVVSIMNYEEASKISYSIRNLAINEKVIDLNSDNTDEYLNKQLFYYCINTDADGTENPYIVWDDVVDETRTTKLSVTYNYNLSLDVQADLVADISTIEKSITTFIASTYGSSIKATLVSDGIEGSEVDSKTAELLKYKNLFEEAKTIIEKLATLKQIESLINYFAKDDMMDKINGLSESLDNIQQTVATISEIIS